MSISSAPAVADFVPPEPTPNDPYPGYYQLPSGDWAAHDPEYYHSFFPTAESAEEAEERGDGRVGRHWEEFNSKGADFIDIDVGKGLQEARAEKERREKMVKPKLPSDEVEYKVSILSVFIVHGSPFCSGADLDFRRSGRLKASQQNVINCHLCSIQLSHKRKRSVNISLPSRWYGKLIHCSSRIESRPTRRICGSLLRNTVSTPAMLTWRGT